MRQLLVLCLSLLCAVASPAAEVNSIDGSSLSGEAPNYVCWPLQDALEDLRSKGLKIIYSSDLVRPEMQVKVEPTATTPQGILDDLLRPHALNSQIGGGATYLVVPTHPLQAATANADSSSGAVAGNSGVVASFVHLPDPDWVEVPFPTVGEMSNLKPEARFAVIRIAGGSPRSLSAEDAFALKELIVHLRSQTTGLLRVALEGSPSDLEAVVTQAVAPYVDAYVYRRDPFRPSHDPTARLWWRSRAEGPELLTRLLHASRKGDELVVLEQSAIDPLHRAFLQRIQGTLSGDLEEQPKVFGLDAPRARFLFNPESGAFYLAIYADLGRPQEVAFVLQEDLIAESLFPRYAEFDFEMLGRRGKLTLDGEYPYYLFELTPRQRDGVAQDLTIRSSRIVDPYEEVVKNQVFQERERQKFHSLDVMEYIDSTPQSAVGRRTGWEHRIIRRRGHLTEYHHLAFLLNGTRYPERKLLKGRIFRADALLAMNPLEIELDETYRYEFLGQETVDGFPTWKIRFEPLKQGSVGDGTFVSGIVWLDQVDHAHRKIRTLQKGLDNSLISQESDFHYGWIASNNECFWDWQRRQGVTVHSYLGEQHASQSTVRREDFKFNRPDIEEVVRQSHESDVLIHVETPPEGHRWLVKDRGRRRVGGFEVEPPAAAQAQTSISEEVPFDAARSNDDTAAPPGGRVLANVHAFSNRTFFSFGGFAVDDDFDVYPGLVFTDSDLFNRGYQAYAGLFLEEAIVSLGKPNLFGSEQRNTGIFFTTSLRLPYARYRDSLTKLDAAGDSHNTDLLVREEALSLTLGVPLGRRATLNASYALRRLGFEATDQTDEAFVTPEDTLEHVASLSLHARWKRFSSRLDLEYGKRQDWQPWGLVASLDLTEPFEEDYTLLRWEGGYFRPIKQHQSFSTSVSYWHGQSLDRFSRQRQGRTRDGVAGFSADFVFDQAVHLNVGYGFRAFKRWPVDLRLESSRQWLDEFPRRDPTDLVGVRARFLVHGPWKLEIWPSISKGLYSNVDGAGESAVLGLSLGWRE